MPAVARRGDRVGHVPRPDAAGPSLRSSASSNDWAPNEIRVTPARRRAAAIAAFVGPGVRLERDLGVGGDPEPRRGRARAAARRSSGGSSDGVPPPR